MSEGQAYGLLLSVATSNETQFASIWNWTRTHLQQPDLLLGWHWAHGKLLSTTPATDADVNTAWALVLAGKRFHDPGWGGAGVAMANAILAKETIPVTTSPGSSAPVLIAGTWAKGPPAIVNPSYFSPRAEAALASATHNAAWSAMASAQTQLLHRLLAAAPLPPAWTTLQSSGAITAIGGPSNPSTPPDYGLNAQRIPVQLAAGPKSDREIAASLWTTIHALPQHGAEIRYSLSGTSLTGAVNPLGLVATAAAAGAAGHRATEIATLAQATRLAQRYPSYYGNAWVALGRVLLTTPWLGTG